MGSSSQQDGMRDHDGVERDPTGRFIRFDEIIGECAFKTIFKGFDEINGIDISWCKIMVSDKILKSKENVDSLCAEASLLLSLKHVNIVRCYHSWFDRENKTIHMITEQCTSGNLRQYCKKHILVDNKAIKNWARQILKGLHYLHCHDPPIIHSDLKPENIFINGNSGRVKIGDLGFALIVGQGRAVQSFAGVLEFMPFMAPELFEEDCSQLVDIYSFGMCLLQMVTRELPYSECSNLVQICKKVSSGVMPAALSKVTEPLVNQLIEKCLAPASERPAAIDLLKDPFLALSASQSLTTFSNLSLRESVGFSPCSTHDQMISVWPAAPLVEVLKKIENEKKIFALHGKMKNYDSICMTLWIGDFASDHADKIKFEYALKTDTILSLMEEMAKELGLPIEDVALVAELMEELIAELVPGSRNCSLSPSLTRDALNLRNISSEKPSADEYYNARQLLDTSGEQDPEIQFTSKNTDSNPLDQASFSTLSSSNRSHHNQDAKQEHRGKHESAGTGKRKCSKEVVRPHTNGLRKLLFTCRGAGTNSRPNPTL